MALYEHVCIDPTCKHEWEDEYSIKDDPPELCPKCGQKTAKRLISLGGKGVVELTGQDYVDKIKSDTKQLKKDMHKSEKVYASMLGEDKYQKLQTQMDRRPKRK
jgi:putative FmdB family regulatory protein